MLISKKLFFLWALTVVLLTGAGAYFGAASAHAEPVMVCPSGRSAVATADTSCAFADNVAANWYSQPGSTIRAYSPVTDLYYTMTCEGGWEAQWWTGEAKRCFGYNSAGVLLVVYVD